MARTLDHIVDDADFEKNYKNQESPRGQRDIFFIWIVLVLISVVGAHFILNLAGGGITGYVTAKEDPVGNVTIMLQAIFVLFIAVLVVALVYFGVSQKDK
jgi:uncharacterized membrane protein YhaH (DUF805 family)